MTIKTIYCDRCGKECEKIRDNRGLHLRHSNDSELLDLCQQCYDELAKWMKGEPNDNT